MCLGRERHTLTRYQRPNGPAGLIAAACTHPVSRETLSQDLRYSGCPKQ
ncbi:unnamed protein product [Ciceribacter sp. T2.26MG-112.2]|nr:unnamed protein product [Ciceribacter naphthalenivorans]